MPCANRSYYTEKRRRQRRRSRLARLLASARQPDTSTQADAPGVEREPDEVVRARLRKHGYRPWAAERDPLVWLHRFMRLYSVLAVAAIVSATVLAAAGTAYASTKTGLVVVADTGQLEAVINKLRLWLVALLGAIATLFFVVGGLRYLSANGDPGEIERAKSALKSSAIGYALALLAPLLIGIVGDLFKS